jgi:hypothetical protein
MTCDTLPLSAGHFHPRIGPALINYKRLSRPIGPLTIEASRGDGRIPKDCYFQIRILGIVKFGCFNYCQCLGLGGDFPLAPCIHELVGQQWGEQVRITCLL